MRRSLVAASLAGLALAVTAPALAGTYYVSPHGDDGDAGTSPTSAWRTVGRVDRAALAPGDRVLFAGGATFTDAVLMPAQSGAAGAPITFSSYGAGRATIANPDGAVWFSGKSWLVFSRLRLTSAGSPTGVVSGSPGGGSTHITLADDVVTGTRGVGVIAPSPDDAHWTIRDSTITHTGDSGLIMLGGPHLITHDRISWTGENPAITWGKHGIYSKGPDQTISDNDLSHDSDGQAISIRYHGARVFGNTIHDTGAALAFFDYDHAPAPQGTSWITDNRAWNLTEYGFYYDGYTDDGQPPSVDIVLRGNRFALASPSAAGIDVALSGSARVTVVGNTFSGRFATALRGARTTIASGNVFTPFPLPAAGPK